MALNVVINFAFVQARDNLTCSLNKIVVITINRCRKRPLSINYETGASSLKETSRSHLASACLQAAGPSIRSAYLLCADLWCVIGGEASNVTHCCREYIHQREKLLLCSCQRLRGITRTKEPNPTSVLCCSCVEVVSIFRHMPTFERFLKTV